MGDPFIRMYTTRGHPSRVI